MFNMLILIMSNKCVVVLIILHLDNIDMYDFHPLDNLSAKVLPRLLLHRYLDEQFCV